MASEKWKCYTFFCSLYTPYWKHLGSARCLYAWSQWKIKNIWLVIWKVMGDYSRRQLNKNEKNKKKKEEKKQARNHIKSLKVNFHMDEKRKLRCKKSIYMGNIVVGVVALAIDSSIQLHAFRCHLSDLLNNSFKRIKPFNIFFARIHQQFHLLDWC